MDIFISVESFIGNPRITRAIKKSRAQMAAALNDYPTDLYL